MPPCINLPVISNEICPVVPMLFVRFSPTKFVTRSDFDDLLLLTRLGGAGLRRKSDPFLPRSLSRDHAIICYVYDMIEYGVDHATQHR